MELDIVKQINNNSNNNLNTIIKSKYDREKKLDLARKINKIKKKEYLMDIFNIITNSSEDYTENTNGVFIFFHNLEDDVYEKLENYVNQIYKLHRKKNSIKSIINSELSDGPNNFSDTFFSDNVDFDSINKELSNKEKMIMRKKKYQEYLDQNQD